MDATGSTWPNEMPLLVKPILEGDADLVNGSRVLGEFERESVVRHLGVHFFSGLVDPHDRARASPTSRTATGRSRADVLRRLEARPGPVLGDRAPDRGHADPAAHPEVPITIRARAGGESKKPKNSKYAWNFSKAIVKTWLR